MLKIANANQVKIRSLTAISPMKYSLKNNELYKKIEHHIQQEEPNEACGFVIMGTDDYHYIPCENIAPFPMDTFIIRPEDYLMAARAGNIIALLHSHPFGPPVLSEPDRIMQKISGFDWWLVCEGRIFCFGVNDEEAKYVVS